MQIPIHSKDTSAGQGVDVENGTDNAPTETAVNSASVLPNGASDAAAIEASTEHQEGGDAGANDSAHLPGGGDIPVANGTAVPSNGSSSPNDVNVSVNHPAVYSNFIHSEN